MRYQRTTPDNPAVDITNASQCLGVAVWGGGGGSQAQYALQMYGSDRLTETLHVDRTIDRDPPTNGNMSQ